MDEQTIFNTTEILKDLNPEQKEAVNCIEGPLLVMAGAGSGKTRVLTCRIANLIAQGISPENILAITFTNKAANEMKSRARKLIGSPAGKIILSTFHSFCAWLLRREIEVTGNFNSNFAIYDVGDTKTLIRQCLEELKLDDDIFSNVHLKISDFKSNLLEPKKCRERLLHEEVFYRVSVQEIYTLYQKKLQENNALDFDDLIFQTVKIFKDYPEILEKYQERFKYISVDEYQDTNIAQYVLTNLLAAKYKNLCVVGDADQSIYGWRGADMRNILNFERDYPNARVIKLEQNYRSTKIILEAANAVIRNNKNRKPKNLWTENDGGEKIQFAHCKDDKEESAQVAGEIRRLVDWENFSYNDIALLYRTNAQSRIFEESFPHAGIPYVIVGGLKFYDRKEIRDIVAYLHVVANPRDNVHLMRIINTPRRGLGSATLNRVATFADSQGLSIFELVSESRLFGQIEGLGAKGRAVLKNFVAMMMSFTESAKNFPPDKLIELILEETGYMKMLRENLTDNTKENISRLENLGEFIGSAKDFVELNPKGTLQDFLNHIALITDLDTVDEENPCVKLMTVHAAKGLEFPVVFVVGMEDGIFPHANSLGYEDELEEERRACYVAFTRAKKKLYITAAEERMAFGKIRPQKISRFIKEIPTECIIGNLPKMQNRKPQPRTTPPPQPKPTYKPPTAYRPAQMKPAEKKVEEKISWNVGDKLNHKKFGLGTVIEVKGGDVVTVFFSNPEAGVKTLKATIAPINKL